MTKIARKTQKIFGSTAGASQIAQIGSLAAAAPVFSTDPDTIQALSNYLTGWFSVVIGSNSPAIEDMNALCFLFARQLAYLFQSGVAEWDTATVYYIGSFASDGVGNIYSSLTDTNTGNALTSAANWKRTNGPNLTALNPATQSPYAIVAASNNSVFLVNADNGAMQINLPVAVAGFRFTVKDSAGSAPTYNITIHRAAAETIEGYAGDYLCKSAYGEWTFACDGTNWYLIA